MRDQKLSNGFPTLERLAPTKVRGRYPRFGNAPKSLEPQAAHNKPLAGAA